VAAADRGDEGGVRRALGWVLGWLLAAALAVTVGVLAVTSLGASIRDRGPIGDNQLIRQADVDEGSGSVDDTGAQAVQRTFTDEFGSFVVECRGVYASGVSTAPDTAAGWQVVTFERGPDDDVDAVFVNGERSIDVEVFCDRGEPTVAEIERHVLDEDDD
jgi:hypothetical protein